MSRLYVAGCLLLFGFLLLHSCQPSSDTSSPVSASAHSPSDTLTYELTKADAFAGYDTVTIQIHKDHSRHSSARYQGFALMPLLRKLIAQHQIDSAQATVFFTCKDGYIPSSSFMDLAANGKGYLAFRDHSQPEDMNWPDSLADSYSPFYLVWEDIPYGDNHLPWPFGLVSLQVVESSDPYAELFPHDNPEMEPAFLLYKENCLKCHAINGKGGTMGPEFNNPRNITTYWTRENIIAFAQNPQSFRSNSKMPAVKGPTEASFHLIVDYLEYLANRSVSH